MVYIIEIVEYNFYMGTCYKDFEIDLTEGDGGITNAQLLRVGEFVGGNLKVTEKMLGEFIENFNRNARRQTVDSSPALPVNFSHNREGEAAGWIKNVMLNESGDELWIEVEWTPTGREKIENKQFKFLSAELSTAYVDTETKEKFGATLLGAGLTNIPEVRGQREIELDENLNEEETKMSLSDILDFVKEAGADDLKAIVTAAGGAAKTELSEATVKLDETKKELSEKDGDINTLKASVLKLSQDIATSKKEAEFQKMLSAAKACEAQRKPFMDGDMIAFAAAYVPVNLSENGHTNGNGDIEASTDSDADKALELAMKRSKEEGIDFDVALSEIVAKTPALSNQYN